MPPRPADKLKLTFSERIQKTWIISVTFMKVCGTAMAAPFISIEKKSRDRRRHMAYARIRHFYSQCTSKIEQALSVDTDEQYRRWAIKARVEPEKETLEDGTEAFWIGSRDAKTILLYFHGGGYNIPSLPGHIDFLERLVRELSTASAGGFAAVLLQYDVSPFERYPRQLSQGAALLNHFRNNLGVPTENIILGGDSAGANLALGIISHILHPHPDESVPRVTFTNGEHLGGAALISPWTDPFGMEYTSLKRNKKKDLLGKRFLQRWSRLWIQEQPYDPYNKPLGAPDGWWNYVDGIVGRVLLANASDDVLIDSGLQFAREFQKAWRDQERVFISVAENEGHISCVIDPTIGFKPEEVQMHGHVRDWLKDVIRSG